MDLEKELKEARERLRNKSYNEFDLLLEQPLLQQSSKKYQDVLLKISQEKEKAIEDIDHRYKDKLEKAIKEYILALNMSVSE